MNNVSASPKLWTMPIVLALLSIGGLTSALLYNGFGDAVSWLALSVPIIVCVRFILKKG